MQKAAVKMPGFGVLNLQIWDIPSNAHVFQDGEHMRKMSAASLIKHHPKHYATNVVTEVK